MSLLLAPAPHAATPFAFVGEASPGSFAADARYGAFEAADGTVTVIDTRTGGTSAHARPRPECDFTDVGGGNALWDCHTYPERAVVLKIRTGALRERVVSTSEIGTGGLTQVGTYWVMGRGSDHRGGRHTSWFTLRSEEDRYDRHGPPDSIEDLDAPGLDRRLCDPLRRQPNPDYDGEVDNDPFLPYQYDGRFGLYFDQGRWTLDRCGRDTSYLLPEKAVAGGLSAGRVTWVKGSKLAARDPVARRSWSWRRGEIDATATRARIEPTRHALFVVAGGPGQDTPDRIYMAPFPG